MVELLNKELHIRMSMKTYSKIVNRAVEEEIKPSEFARNYLEKIDTLKELEEEIEDKEKKHSDEIKRLKEKLIKIKFEEEQSQNNKKEQEDKITQEKKAKDEEDEEFTKNKNDIWKKVVEFCEETGDREKIIKFIKKLAKNKKQKERLIQELINGVNHLLEEK